MSMDKTVAGRIETVTPPGINCNDCEYGNIKAELHARSSKATSQNAMASGTETLVCMPAFRENEVGIRKPV
jgi:hypothetical protein